jgi:hypothetical protein
MDDELLIKDEFQQLFRGYYFDLEIEIEKERLRDSLFK